ncbi:MAG: hypothetical protein LIO93_00915, partial [Bacteroidales bacterium]|nr:hypothetical protein [Bacteroidales bacterium]
IPHLEKITTFVTLSKIEMKEYLFLLTFVLLFSCCNNDKEAAQKQLQEARILYENAEFGSAKQVLDSLKIKFPKELSAQKEALALMREIEVEEQKRNIAFCDSMFQVRRTEADSLKQHFIFEKTEYDNQGRYIDKNYNPQPGYASKYIKIHVDEKSDLVLSSVYRGSPIKHNQVKVSIPSGEYAETEIIPFDGGANYSFKDLDGITYETVTYQKGKDNGVLQFIHNYADNKITLEYLGGKKTSPYVLSAKEKKAVVNTVHFAAILKDLDQFKSEREKAEKRLEYLQTKIH